MYLGPKSSSVASGVPVFQNVIETAQGGFTLDTANLTVGATLPAGNLLNLNEATRIAKAVLTLTMQDVAANNAVAYKVKKGTNAAVGQYLAREDGEAAYAITAIDTSNANYDLITVGTTLGVALVAGDALFISDETGANAAEALPVHGLLYQNEIVQVGAPVSAVIRGTVYARRIPGATDAQKASLPNIIFSQSF